MANSNNTFSVGGPATQGTTVDNAGLYTVAATLQLPQEPNDVGWSVSQPTAPTGAASQVVTNVMITVTLSSSAPVDQAANIIRAPVTIS